MKKNDDKEEEAILKFKRDEQPLKIEKNMHKYNKSKSNQYKYKEKEIEDTFDNLFINNYIENPDEKEHH